MYDTINFSDLHEYIGKGVIWMAVTFPDDVQDTKKQVTEFFKEPDLRFLTEGNEVIDIKFISGNVLGSDGRSDYLLVLKDGVKGCNPMARFKIWDLVWVEDFIENNRGDYNS